MLTPGAEFTFAPEFDPAPPALAAVPPDPPLLSAAFSEPPGAPALVPSGEIAMRAARFPCGTLTSGAGGAGAAEIAIKRCRLSSPAEVAGPITGAAPASAWALRRSATGLDIGFTGSFGSAFTLGDEAMFSWASFLSVLATSGAVRSAMARCCTRGATTEGEIRSCGFAGWGEVAAHSAMLGICGTIFGGVAGASGWINGWRGCVIFTGCERIVWRG